MDVHVAQAAPSAAERAAVDAVLGPPMSRWVGGDRADQEDGRVAHGGRRAREQRHLLLPVLHAVQKAVGWISEGAVAYIVLRLTVPAADVYGVASFYAMFSTEPRPPRVAHVCDDLVCRLTGAERLAESLADEFGPPGTPSADGRCTWVRSPCLGLCEHAPAVLFQLTGEEDTALAPAGAGQVVAHLAGPRTADPRTADPRTAGVRTADSGTAALVGGGPGKDSAWEAASARPRLSAPQTARPRDPRLRLFQRVGVADPESLGDYRAQGGYTALRRAVGMGPVGVIREVTDSRLMGRGGAAFPTGVKWDAVAKAPVRPHYLICNADESEPGTFKDRVLMEEDPFALVEAMTIAGFATGCEQGYLYIRGEYPLATRRLENAIAAARTHALLGQDVMGRGFRFDIELRRGAGAYICGEETALINSIEGYRGEPRNKPPFPTQVGLFGKPTVVNNVETLFNILDILVAGGPGFAEGATGGSTGTKLFCVSGSVADPGVYEVPFGATLRELLALAGGIAPGRSLAVVLLGGAAGTFVTADALDTPLTFEGTRAIGASLGSGVILVIDDTADLFDLIRRIAEFFRDESCGQCVPCRVGTVRQEEVLARIAHGAEMGSRKEELVLLGELAQVMRDASICGLGHTASMAVQSAISLGLISQLSGERSARAEESR